ncbi:MAG: Cell division and transport-associated protein TolR [Acidobacteria bacterium]|jgi:biopolymer transport protein ExbD/biopolymer transport protein TolR|nr:Cell division and transport-associated protein TolR [Acidobacteriota bacterium]
MAFTNHRGDTSTSLSEINVTPLVDVMLVLLIIFMVTAPMLQTGIDVQLPETRALKSEDPAGNIVISISREGFLYYGSQQINLSALGGHLKEDVKSSKDAIYLRADKDVKWNSIVTVIDAIRGAGFSDIKLVTKPFKEPQSR